MGRLILAVLFAAGLSAEVRTMRLAEVVARALEQNPDVALARLDEQIAAHAVREARDPFVPKVAMGSGLAYSNGFPMSIEGSAPSIVQAAATGSIYNPQRKYLVAQARENSRGAALDTQVRRDEVALKTAFLFLEADYSSRSAEMARQQAVRIEGMAEAVRLRVAEGRALPIENRRAALDLARARQRAEALESNREFIERSLAVALGLDAEDRVRPAREERAAPTVPECEEAAVERALEDNREIRRLESALMAKNLEVRSHRAARFPRVDLVAQYGLFARFNNYEDFFRRFQRHNGQLGVSFQIPLLTGSAAAARAAASDAEAARLRLEIGRARNRVALDARQGFQDLKRAETAGEVARLDLEVAREEVSIRLARFEEGRASFDQIEQARSLEADKWTAFYDARLRVEKARLQLLRQTGELAAALR